MKIVLIIVTVFLILVMSYFLYQHSLGSIPFLIASFVLFYLVLKNSNSKDDEKDEKRKMFK